MISQRGGLRLSGQGELFGRAFRVLGSRSQPSCNALLPASKSPFLGSAEDFEGRLNCHDNVLPRFLQNLGTGLGFRKVKQNASVLSSMGFRSSIHSSSQKEFETGSRTSRSMDFVRGIIEEDRKDILGGNWRPQYQVENNADVVHIKMMRNNSFITLTDSKGNTKFRSSSGSLSGGSRVSRYAAEAAAELAGRKVREMGIKSVVVKVNGFTFFKKKKQAILSLRDGYTYNRGDKNPIVYIEDTTRKPHNGCRLPKKRRI